MARLTVSVPTIHCEGCATHIQAELGESPGLSRVEVDVSRKRVSIEYDSTQTTQEALQEKLKQIGFAPSGIVQAEKQEALARLPSENKVAEPSRTLWYWLFVIGVGALALAGYIGYELYPRFNLPPVEGVSLLLLSAGAGIASFFSPCAFPLLVTLLARETGVEARREARSITKPLLFASALSFGAAVFLLLGGVIIALGGGMLFAGVTFTSAAGMTIRVVVGSLLILLGLIQLEVLPNPLHAVDKVARPFIRSQARYRRRSPVLGFTIFGFGYLLAGFG